MLWLLHLHIAWLRECHAADWVCLAVFKLLPILCCQGFLIYIYFPFIGHELNEKKETDYQILPKNLETISEQN